MAAPSPVPGVGLETETALRQWPLSGSQAALISQDRSRAFWTTVSRWAGPVWEPVCLAAPGCAREGWDGTGGPAGCRSRVELPALEQLSLLQVSEGQATGRSRTRLALSGAVSEPAAPPREVVPAAQQMGEVVCLSPWSYEEAWSVSATVVSGVVSLLGQTLPTHSQSCAAFPVLQAGLLRGCLPCIPPFGFWEGGWPSFCLCSDTPGH